MTTYQRFIMILAMIIGVSLGGPGWCATPSSTTPAAVPQTDWDQDKPPEKKDTQMSEQDGRYLFDKGYEFYTRKKHAEASQYLHQFLSRHTPDTVDYEWAEFFFGISLKELGYTHASVDILSHLVGRKPNPKIVNYTLEVLEQISLEGPFDRDLLVDRALCDHSYGFIEDHMSDFVHYYHGEYDWEHGLYEWGDEHFAKIQTNSYYYQKFLFKKALREYYRQRNDEAVELLKTALFNLPDGTVLKDDVRKTLARIYYETGKFEKADILYQHIEMNIVEQAQNLLERAWVHYRMGNPERAMGLLYSFQAPSYTNSFTPEFYILKSFIYKDVCHYKKAMQVLDQFRERYGDTLENIYQRRKPQDNNAMLLVILNKPRIKRLWEFLNTLESESAKCAQIQDPELKSYLERLYVLESEVSERRFRLLVNDEFEKMANNMLRFEEEAHLMEYEIGLDMYQRVHDFHYSEDDAQETDAGGTEVAKAVYQFQGEFWNDELDDYEVILPNKCQNAEEWDIFFK